MNLLEVSMALVLGVLIGALVLFDIGATSSGAIRFSLSIGVVASYAILIGLATDAKRRTISVTMQTVLGTLVGVTVATIFRAPAEGYAAAILLGLILGFTADMWIKLLGRIPFP